MAYQSAFSRATNYIPPSKPTPAIDRIDWRGLDLSTPHDAMEENRASFARNFRIYSIDGDDRRVAISSRKGSGEYVVPLNEAVDTSVTAVTGAADASVGVDTEWKAMSFTAVSSEPLTMVELNLKKDSTTLGPLVVEIYDDDSGAPGNLLASSGILGSAVDTTYAYVPAHFIEAPTLTATDTYWIVAYIQDDGSGTYYWSSTTDSTSALTSNSSGLSWDATAYSLNFKAYTADDADVTGVTRYTPTTGNNKTIIGIGTAIYEANDNTGALTSIVTGLNANTTRLSFTQGDDKLFIANGYDAIQVWDGTTATTLTHAVLDTPSEVLFHKNLLFTVSASDPNKVQYSEAPGNDDGAGNEWYEAFLSTSFVYVPVAKAADPITNIVSFQDSLIVFLASDKWVLYGDSPANFTLRQATGRKGAVAKDGILADENYIYFVGKDGFYRYNGAQDDPISDRVQPEIADIADLTKVVCVKWKRKIRFYYPSSGSSVNDHALIWDEIFEEWLLDTDTYVSHAVALTDADDEGYLIEASSTAPVAHYAEQNDHNLGKQMDFLYYCRAESMGNPAQKKRIIKFFPLLEAENGDYPVQVGVDRDRRDQTTYQDYNMTSGASLVGSFDTNDGVTVGGETSYEPKRFRVTGYGYYWQVRIKRKAINNPVQFIGYILSYRTKKM